MILLQKNAWNYQFYTANLIRICIFFSVLWIFLLKFIKFLQDYSLFFERHALNSTYPGYRAPPGTQHYGYQYPQYPQHPQYHQ